MNAHRPWYLNAGLSWIVVMAFGVLALFPVEVRAALVESRLSSGETISQRSAEIESIRQVLEMEVVSQRLADYGLSQEEIMAKLPTMSDSQIHQLASLSADIAAGDGLGFVIAVLVIIFLVLLILQVTGRQVIIR
jgi:hypothetical protein